MSDTEQENPVVVDEDPTKDLEEVMNGDPATEDPFKALNGDLQPDLLNGSETPAMNGDSAPIDDTAPPVASAVEENGVDTVEAEEFSSDLASEEFGGFGEVESEAVDMPATQQEDDPFSALGSSQQEDASLPDTGDAGVTETPLPVQDDPFSAFESIATEPTESVLEQPAAASQEDPLGVFDAVYDEQVESTDNGFSQVLTEDPTSNGAHSPEVAEEGAADEEPVQEPVEEETIKVAPDEDVFSGATDGPGASETTEEAATNCSNVFGDLSTAAAGDESTEPSVLESGGDAIGGVTEGPDASETTEELAPPEPEEAKTYSNVFGDLTAASVGDGSAELVVPESGGDEQTERAEIGEQPDAAEDIADQLEALDFAANTLTEPPEVTQESTVEADDDNDFGDFSATSKTAVDTAPEESSEPATEVDVDDFGDFAESSQAEPVVDRMAKEPGPSQESAAVTDDDDDFGDFAATSQTADPAQERSVPEAIDIVPEPVDDDNFGDFREFSDAAPSAETQAPAASDPAAPIDNFSFAPPNLEEPPEPEPTPVAEDDDFGDFGDFNDPPQSAEPAAPEPTPAAADDDFGDFGDFNDAPQAAAEPTPSAPAVDDDFGDFGDFSDSPEPIRVAPHVEITLNDPFVDRAKTVFTEIFGKSSQEDEKEEGEAVNETVALRDILVDILSETKEQESLAADWTNEKLDSILESVKMCEKASPSVIMDRQAVQPYSHYSIPVVIPSLELKTGDKKSKRWASSESAIPKVEGVEPALSENAEVPDEETEEVSNAADADATVVEIPPSDVKLDFTDFKAPLENGDSGTANEAPKPPLSAAKLFLQQIPNLSFMLSSTLSLPPITK